MYRMPFKYIGFIFLVWLFCDLVNPPQARTDWINLTGAETAPTIAEIYVLDDHVKVVLEIYIRDLTIFDDLVPDDWGNALQTKRPSIDDLQDLTGGVIPLLSYDTGEGGQPS